MRLKLHASKRNISALMVLIVVQVSITCVWLALNGNSDGAGFEQTESDQNKLKQRQAVLHSIVQTPRTNSTKVSPRSKNGSASRSEETVSRERSTRVQSTQAQMKGHAIRKVQVPQSKWLLRLFTSAKSYCNGKVEFYENMTALLRDVIVDPSKAHTQAKGGEKIKDVLLQKESAEFYQLENGLFNIENCSNMPGYARFTFGHSSTGVDRLSNAVKLSKGPYRTQGGVIQEYDGDFVIILTRYEYANVYWTVIDLYNTFLMLQLYNRTFQDTDLWILDAHPDTSLDGLFKGTFRRVFRLTEFQNKTRFRNLLPGFSRAKTPMLMKVLRPLTLVSKFRSDVLSALRVPLKSDNDRKNRCEERSLNVLFIWRRNYVGHPRNPKGVVSRKISNENELLNVSKQHFPNYSIQGVQLDKLQMDRQLELVGNADIMVGMHGAAFGFTVFMQEGAGILEMWPRGLQGNWHMEYLAKRSGVYYQTWQNNNAASEDLQAKSTRVSADAVKKKLDELSISICSKYKENSVR